jgi:hypothetical protein
MAEESIYNLIPEKVVPPARPPRYTSKHSHTLPPSYSTFGTAGTGKVLGNVSGVDSSETGPHKAKKAAATFGRNVAGEIDKKQFLKRGEGITHTEPIRHEEKTKLKPSVPSRKDVPVMGLATDKNFVVANAVETILAVPKKPKQDDKRHVGKVGYGSVPTYLKQIKAELKTQYAAIDHAEAEKAKQGDPRLHKLDDHEAQQLVDGLRAKWEQRNKQFQTLRFNLETTSQVRRKEALEAEMRALEEAINKVSNRTVFVFDD